MSTPNQPFTLPVAPAAGTPATPTPPHAAPTPQPQNTPRPDWAIDDSAPPPSPFGAQTGDTGYTDSTDNVEYLDEEYGDIEGVFWSVEGWSEQQPFNGEIVFTDQNGALLAAIPVEPESMQNLNAITAEILRCQYAAFGIAQPGVTAVEAEPILDTDGQPSRKVIEKDIAGVPFRMSINTRYLAVIGIIFGLMVVVAFASTIFG